MSKIGIKHKPKLVANSTHKKRNTQTQKTQHADVQAAMQAIDTIARRLWPSSRAVLFGSQATGLALPGSDLDIVILGATTFELARAGTGYTRKQRQRVSEQLEDLLDALLKNRVVSGKAQIIEARVPIIKCRLACLGAAAGTNTASTYYNDNGGNGFIHSSGSNTSKSTIFRNRRNRDLFGSSGNANTSTSGIRTMAADISLGVANGAAAVHWVRRQILAVPPLRPLTLVVKALLRDKGMNEVYTGGLGSYAVVNMVLAHLQANGYCIDSSNDDGGGGAGNDEELEENDDAVVSGEEADG